MEMNEDPVEVNPFEKKVKKNKKNKVIEFNELTNPRTYMIDFIILIILFYLLIIEAIGIIYGFAYRGSIDLG